MSEVIAVIEKALEIELGSLTENTLAEEVENWDSLGHLSILIKLDKMFDGKIANIAAMSEADSMTKIINILRQHNLI